MKKIFSIIMVLAGTMFLTSTASAQTKEETSNAVLKVSNLTCNGDMPTIKKQLLNQDGVIDVNFTERKNNISTFTVQYQNGVTDRNGIIKIIETTPGCDDKSSTPYKVKKEKE